LSDKKLQFKKIEFSKVHDVRGDLTFIQGEIDIPFNIARVYYIHNAPVNAQRGGHAHKDLEQVIIALSGSFRLILDNGKQKFNYWLNNPQQGIYINKLVWREIDTFSQGAVCMVLASELFKESDYYRDYEEFLKAVS